MNTTPTGDPTVTTKHTPKKMGACLLKNAELSKMITALKKTKAFNIERTTETVTVTHTKSGLMVLAAISKTWTGKGPWITRIATDLFTQTTTQPEEATQ